jgi:hypothetical protein
LSLPWVFIPYKIWKFHYIDWWVVNNLPVDILEWKVIVWVSALKNITWPLVSKKKIFGFEINANFFEYNYQVLHRAILFMMKQNEDKSIKDLKWKWIIIKPNFWDLDYYDYKKIDKFVNIWYKEAKKKLGEIEI